MMMMMIIRKCHSNAQTYSQLLPREKKKCHVGCKYLSFSGFVPEDSGLLVCGIVLFGDLLKTFRLIAVS
jgi:hypothetical protein